jgi:antitoxin component YwqK of YwqJK toxin-antitoxin module
VSCDDDITGSAEREFKPWTVSGSKHVQGEVYIKSGQLDGQAIRIDSDTGMLEAGTWKKGHKHGRQLTILKSGSTEISVYNQGVKHG